MPQTILIVDDQFPTRAILRFNLEQAGFEVIEAANGVRAWEALQDRPVDLLITDMSMPQVSGIDLCKLIRQDARLATMPIIVFTGFALKLDEQTRETLRISRFESKPFSPRRLVALVSELLAVGAT